MSISEQQVDTLFGVAIDDWHILWRKAQELRVPVRNLITAVRAEMPCSSYYVAELQADDCFDLGEYSEGDKWPPSEAFTPCPSCSARAELAKVAEVV